MRRVLALSCVAVLAGGSVRGLIMTSQAWAAEPAANPFASREVAPGWTLTHFGQGEQRRFERPLEAAFADGKLRLPAL
jgi:hypothetical protein